MCRRTAREQAGDANLTKIVKSSAEWTGSTAVLTGCRHRAVFPLLCARDEVSADFVKALQRRHGFPPDGATAQT